jgi:hypothetical protein
MESDGRIALRESESENVEEEMRGRFLVPLATGILAGARVAMGQSYAGTVLYQLPAVPSELSEAAAGGQTVQQGYLPNESDLDSHAILTTSSGSVDINPAGFTVSGAYGTSGSQQVGAGYGTETGGIEDEHAVLWTGTGASAIDLNPTNLTGFTNSEAVGTNGSQQVGDGEGPGTNNNQHALMWNGSASTAVDLNPALFSNSMADGTDGTHQVGAGAGTATGGQRHALMWTGTAASVVDLNPPSIRGIVSSVANGIGGGVEVGWGSTTATSSNQQAMLWKGTAVSAVDLNPTNLSGYATSDAFNTNGAIQVGWGAGSATAFNQEAMLWSGSSASAVNLQALLPASGLWDDSWAYTVDSSGDIFGVAGGTYDNIGTLFGVEWTPVPEPLAGSMMVIVGAGIMMRRRRRIYGQ